MFAAQPCFMSLLRFKVSWEEDDTVLRTIEMLSTQTFFDLHTCLRTALQLPGDMEAMIYAANDRWDRGMAISSTVEKNLRDAPALSMKKTPVAALVNDPHQKFVYVCQHPKGWVFLIELLTLAPVPTMQRDYPVCIHTEGISPSQFGNTKTGKDAVMEIMEKYDLESREGFGDEGEEDDETGGEEGSDGGEESQDGDFLTDDF